MKKLVPIFKKYKWKIGIGGGIFLLALLLFSGRAEKPPIASLPFSEKRKEIEQWPEVQFYAKKYGWEPSWLANAILKESGGDKASANWYYNKETGQWEGTNATGLLQLMPKYIREEGYTPGRHGTFAKLSRAEQLAIFDKRYFSKYGKYVKGPCDFRLMMFLPTVLEKGVPQDAVVYSKSGYNEVGFSKEYAALIWAKNEGRKRKEKQREFVRRKDIC